MALKLLHTSDVHLGAKFLMLGRNAEAHREDLKKTFSSLIDLLMKSDAQFLLIAGDLFDSNFVSYAHINFVVRELKRVGSEKYVVIIPGSHDPLTADSIYFRKEFANISPQVYVFNEPTVYYKSFPEFDITFWARPNLSNRSQTSPLDIDRSQNKVPTAYNVALAHGSVQIEGKASPDDLPVHFSGIESSKMNYIALGHWHGAQDFSRGSVGCWYSGSPEITYQEGKGGLGSGYVLEVALDKGSTTVKPIKVSQRDFDEVEIDVGESETEEDLFEKLLAGANDRLIRRVHLTGLASPQLLLDEALIEAECGDRFFALKVKNEAHFRRDASQKDYPKEFISGQFLSILEEKLESAKTEEERIIIEEVIQLGLAELEGKRII